MIKNIVFDVSGVLLKFNFWGCIEFFNWSPEVKKQISEIIFESEKGQEFFNGKISTIKFYKTLIKQYPNHKDEIKQIFYPESLPHMMPPNYNTFELLKELKESGYNIYILSNMDKSMSEYFRNVFEIDNYISGAVYSFEVNFKKPNRKIFDALIEKYNLNPSETLYIDDSTKNTEAARNLGFNTIVFKNAEKTIPKIRDFLKKNSSQTQNETNTEREM